MPLELLGKTNENLRAEMHFYPKTIMIKKFFQTGGIAEIDSIQKTINGEPLKQLLHIKYDDDGK